MASSTKVATARVKSLPKYTSPFPMLHLREADQQALREITHSLVQESLHDFERYVDINDAGVLPRDQWKLLHQQDQFRVYLERNTTQHAQGARGNTLATIIGTGTIQGTVEDCLHGVTTASIAQTRIKGAYHKDTLDNLAVLAELETPSAETPFQSMSVRWVVKTIHGMLHTVLKHEDSTIIEATGKTVTTETNQVVGYHLVHSIELPMLPKLKEYTRVELSAVTLWQALDAHRVRVYLKTFADMKTVLVAPALAALAEVFSVTTKYPQTSYLNKLSYVLRCRPLRARFVRDEQGLASMIKHCATCNVALSRVLGPRRHVCRLCLLPTCSTCSLRKFVFTMPMPNGDIREHRVRVCRQCWQAVVALDPEEVAAAEVAASSSTGGQVNVELSSVATDDDASSGAGDSEMDSHRSAEPCGMVP